MKMNRLVKAFVVKFDNGTELSLRQCDEECWDIFLDDDCYITTSEVYALARDIFEKDVAKEIETITVFIDDEPRFTVNRDTTKEEFLCKLIDNRPIIEIFD